MVRISMLKTTRDIRMIQIVLKIVFGFIMV
jgi:hypothetical protein